MGISIKYFFPIIITITFFIASLILIGGLIYFFYSYTINGLIQDKIGLLSVVQRSIYDPMFYYRTYSTSPESERIIITEASKSPGVAFLRIVDPATGKIICSGDEKEIGIIENVPPAFSDKPSTRDGTWNNRPVKEISLQGVAGEGLWMGVDLSSVRQAASKIIWQAVLLVVFIMLISYAFLYFILRKVFILPFGGIINTIYQLGEGNLDMRVSPSSRALREIGEISDALNKMTEDLKKSHAALEEVKSALEIKVAARTRELNELTDNLEEEVRRRTKELQDKIGELEKFQKLTVGRELKMKILKDEMGELKKELEEYKENKK